MCHSARFNNGISGQFREEVFAFYASRIWRAWDRYHLKCPYTVADISVFHHTVCWWKVGGELGKLRQEMRWDLEAVCPRWLWAFFSLVSYCLLFEWQYTQFGPLYLCFTQTYTQTPLPHADAGTHTYRWGRVSFPACSQSPWHCLFTLHCDSCVCVCVCVDLRKEILRVKCSPGLNYHFWVLSHHPTSQGLAVFLSVSL